MAARWIQKSQFDMPKIEIVLPKPHAGQERVKREAKRFNVVACGRRWGKSTFGIDRAIAPEVLHLPVAWFSPTYKMLLEVWREADRITRPIQTRRNASDHRLEFVTGGLLEFWSLDNEDAARGRKYRRAIIDEAGILPRLMDAWNFVIRPTLTDYRGDGWIFSTPKGRNGFYQMFQWGADPLESDWMCWQMPTSSNPHIDPNEIESLHRALPERVYRQEILAEFLEDAGGVFRHVAECATAIGQSAAIPGHSYVMGVDWGKLNDFTVISVIDATTRSLVFVDRFNQIDYAVQVGRLQAICGRFAPVAVVVERNSMGDPLVEQAARLGLPIVAFTTTNASKTAIIDALAFAFERREIQIISDPVLVAELQSYEMERLKSGMLRYSAPEGLHDDCVMSLALAWSEVVSPTGGDDGLVVYDDLIGISPV